MASILVTGGTGYIGSHTAVELIEKGYDVVIADNFSNSQPEVLDAIKEISGKSPRFFETDLRDHKATQELFRKAGDIVAVIHFAAFKAVGESVADPLLYYRNNLFSLVNVLEAMREMNCENLVFSSSCTVYGQPEKLPVTETSEVSAPQSPYGNTKKISEEIIRDVVKTGIVKCVSLRYFNPIGAHPTAKIGELPNGIPNNLVPFITQTAIGKRPALKVFGNDYNTPDGTCVRDYIHVVDLAKAHVKAIDRLLKKATKNDFEVFNLGTGQGNTVLDIINTFQGSTGVKLNYEIAPRRPGDVEKIWADTSHANKELGWKTELSLKDALQSAWNWEKYLSEKK